LRLTETELPGVHVLDVEPQSDDRGFFARTFDAREFDARRLDPRVAQCSLSFNKRAGTLRGMHFQVAPHGEAKLVRCVSGALFDVALDLRPHAATYLHWVGVELSAENRRALYIPEDVAHGFQTLVDATEILYSISEFYEPAAARGVRWDDPAFEIEWPEAERTISERDLSWPDFDESVLR
jgi:dTDP-4-dehydrorhamnose 3,5-epimerase